MHWPCAGACSPKHGLDQSPFLIIFALTLPVNYLSGDRQRSDRVPKWQRAQKVFLYKVRPCQTIVPASSRAKCLKRGIDIHNVIEWLCRFFSFFDTFFILICTIGKWPTSQFQLVFQKSEQAKRTGPVFRLSTPPPRAPLNFFVSPHPCYILPTPPLPAWGEKSIEIWTDRQPREVRVGGCGSTNATSTVKFGAIETIGTARQRHGPLQNQPLLAFAFIVRL